jgi:hypothetical protein
MMADEEIFMKLLLQVGPAADGVNGQRREPCGNSRTLRASSPVASPHCARIGKYARWSIYCLGRRTWRNLVACTNLARALNQTPQGKGADTCTLDLWASSRSDFGSHQVILDHISYLTGPVFVLRCRLRNW